MSEITYNEDNKTTRTGSTTQFSTSILNERIDLDIYDFMSAMDTWINKRVPVHIYPYTGLDGLQHMIMGPRGKFASILPDLICTAEMSMQGCNVFLSSFLDICIKKYTYLEHTLKVEATWKIVTIGNKRFTSGMIGKRAIQEIREDW